MGIIRTIDLTEAERVANAIIKVAATDGKDAVCVAVVDNRGDLVVFKRMDKAPLRSISIAINKAYTSARTHQDTLILEEKLRKVGRNANYYTDNQITLFPGGAKLELSDGTVIGGVGVSGRLPEEDHELAIIGASLLKPTFRTSGYSYQLFWGALKNIPTHHR